MPSTDEIVALIKPRLKHEAHLAQKRFIETIQEIRARLVGSGMYNSSFDVQLTQKEYERDIESRQATFLAIVKEVLDKIRYDERQKIRPGLTRLASEWLGAHIEKSEKELRVHAERIGPHWDNIDLGLDRIMRSTEAEINLLVQKPQTVSISSEVFVDPEQPAQLRSIASQRFELSEHGMNLTDFLRRVDEIIVLGQQALANKRSNDYGTWLNPQGFATFRAAALSLLANLYSERHPYYLDFNVKVADAEPGHAETGIGILTAVKGELSGGWFVTARGLISAEIFADFLEMAEYLLTEQYKDAAAVIAGSSLEEHLRQLATKHGISTTRVKGAVENAPKTADALNADLARVNAYTKLDQKSVTAWLDLRNKAAHAKYTEYDGKQVGLMLEGIRQFMARVPV
jgi:hypothetical protein